MSEQELMAVIQEGVRKSHKKGLYRTILTAAGAASAIMAWLILTKGLKVALLLF